MPDKELWLVSENHATVKPDSRVTTRVMKTYSESRIELRNLEILKKMLAKSCQFLSSEQLCEPKSLDVALNIAGVAKIPSKKVCLQSGRWKTRGRGPGQRRTGSRGKGFWGPELRGPGVWETRCLVENTVPGSGKHGVSLENTGSQWETQGNHYCAQLWFFLIKMRSPKFITFKSQWQSIAVKCVLRSWKQIKHFVRKITNQMPTCRAVVFPCMGSLFYFSEWLAWILFYL